MPISFNCTVKSIAHGLSAFSVELWDFAQENTVDNPYGWVQTLGYLDGSGNAFAALESTNFGNFTIPQKETLFGYAFSQEPEAFVEDANTMTSYTDQAPIYIPSSLIQEANGNQWIVCVCRIVTVDIEGDYATSDNLNIQNFNGSQAWVLGNSSSIINGMTPDNYTSTPYSFNQTFGVTANGLPVTFDSLTGVTTAAYIAFGFPIQHYGFDDAAVDILIDVN